MAKPTLNIKFFLRARIIAPLTMLVCAGIWARQHSQKPLKLSPLENIHEIQAELLNMDNANYRLNPKESQEDFSDRLEAAGNTLPPSLQATYRRLAGTQFPLLYYKHKALLKNAKIFASDGNSFVMPKNLQAMGRQAEELTQIENSIFQLFAPTLNQAFSQNDIQTVIAVRTRLYHNFQPLRGEMEEIYLNRLCEFGKTLPPQIRKSYDKAVKDYGPDIYYQFEITQNAARVRSLKISTPVIDTHSVIDSYLSSQTMRPERAKKNILDALDAWLPYAGRKIQSLQYTPNPNL